jgi:hypothetical protein
MAKRRILFTMLLAALLSLPLYLLRDDMDTEEIRKNRYWVVKTRDTCSYDIVFGGDSRVFRGISPEHFAAELQDRSVINYAYWANGYGADYLEGLEEKVDMDSDFRMIVLGISPHSLTRNTARSPHYHAELNRSKESVIQTIYLSQLQQYFAPYGVIDLFEKLTGKSKPNNTRIIYHPDGWVETYWIVPDTSNAAKSYRTLFEGDPVSDEVIDGLLAKVRYWTSKNIYVVGFRPPAYYSIRQFEEQMGAFSECSFVEGFTAAGGIWIPVDPDVYESYDGSHLEHQSAMRLSADLARLIREQVPEL